MLACSQLDVLILPGDDEKRYSICAFHWSLSALSTVRQTLKPCKEKSRAAAQPCTVIVKGKPCPQNVHPACDLLNSFPLSTDVTCLQHVFPFTSFFYLPTLIPWAFSFEYWRVQTMCSTDR